MGSGGAEGVAVGCPSVSVGVAYSVPVEPARSVASETAALSAA